MSIVYAATDTYKIIDALKKGSVCVLPTDTVYGLVCSANLPEACTRLYGLKFRENKPGTIVASSVSQLVDLGIPARYLKPVEHFWPNPISVVVPCGPDLEYLHVGKQSLAVRVFDNTDLRKIIDQTGPLLTTSANLPGQPPANSIAQAQKYFDNQVDLYVDGGDMSGRPASTIVQIVDDELVVLRQGAIKFDDKGEIAK